MKRYTVLWVGLIFSILISQAYASTCVSKRHYYYRTPEAHVWMLKLCPKDPLPAFKNDTTRVLIPLNDGVFHIQYKNGNKRNLILKKNVPIMLSPKEGEWLHQDFDMSNHPLKMIFVEVAPGMKMPMK